LRPRDGRVNIACRAGGQATGARPAGRC